MKRALNTLIIVVLASLVSGCENPQGMVTRVGGRAVALRPGGPIREVYLQGTTVTNEDLDVLNRWRSLWLIHLDSTAITDDGLRHLSGMNQLRGLNLARTQVSDAGLGYLRGMKELEGLVLEETDVSDEAVADLKQSLPNTRIWK